MDNQTDSTKKATLFSKCLHHFCFSAKIGETPKFRGAHEIVRNQSGLFFLGKLFVHFLSPPLFDEGSHHIWVTDVTVRSLHQSNLTVLDPILWMDLVIAFVNLHITK